MASAGSTPNLNLSQNSDKSSKPRFKWNDGDKIDNLLMALQNYKSTMEFSNVDFNSDKPKQYEAVRRTLALIYEADPYQFGPVQVSPKVFLPQAVWHIPTYQILLPLISPPIHNPHSFLFTSKSSKLCMFPFSHQIIFLCT